MPCIALLSFGVGLRYSLTAARMYCPILVWEVSSPRALCTFPSWSLKVIKASLLGAARSAVFISARACVYLPTAYNASTFFNAFEYFSLILSFATAISLGGWSWVG